jgi:hypothetical protein
MQTDGGLFQIDRLIEEQKLEQASQEVLKALAAARKAGNEADWTRALTRETQLRIGLSGFETAVRFLKEEPEDGPVGFDENADLSSTRVVSAEALRKLAQDSEQQFARGKVNGNGNGHGAGENGAAPSSEDEGHREKPGGAAGTPATDWFVAVDVQQQDDRSILAFTRAGQ